MEPWAQISDQLRNGRPCVLVTVLATRGSAPREAGARMVVCADGGFFGTIGGGALEWQAMAHADRLLSEASAGFEVREFALGPNLGQCCGGHVSLGFEPFYPSALAEATRLANLGDSMRGFATRGLIGADGVVRRIVLEEPDPTLDAGLGREAAMLEPNGTLWERFGQTRRPLYLFGAGHVARGLVLALAPHSFQINWIDSRDDAFPRHMPANTSPHRVASPAAMCDRAGSDAFILVMTHSHALDEDIVAAALSKSRFDYVGLIGSQSKKARFVTRLKQRGLSPAMIDRLVCPIGIAGITSKTPAAIATSVAAQLLVRDESARRNAVRPLLSQTAS